jgi:hypothetical protein
MDNQALAFHIGQIIGVLLILGLFLGLVVFFIIALIKAITTRRTGWIVGACVSAVPLLLIFILFGIGFVAGLKNGFGQSREMAAARRGEASELVTAPMTPITGNGMAYEISLPSADEWQRKDNDPPYDYLFSHNEAYVGIIAENVGLQTPEKIRDLAQKNIEKKAKDYSFTDAEPIQIDSQNWLTFDAAATLESGIKIKYRFYVYSDADHTIQIITWTLPTLFEHDAPVFDRIANSFKLPK